MYRPANKHQHLLRKIADKQARSHKKPGKRSRRWKKWAETHKDIAEAGGSYQADAP